MQMKKSIRYQSPFLGHRLFLSVNWADSTKHNSPQPLTLPKELGQFKRSYDFKEYGRFKSYEVIHNVRKNKFEHTSPTNNS